MLLLHLILAVLSVFSATFAFVKSSRSLLKAVYLLSAGVVLSGVILGVETTEYVGRLCLSGAAYLGFMVLTLRSVRKQLKMADNVEFKNSTL